MREIERLMEMNIVEDLGGLQDLELGSEEHRIAVDTTDKQLKDLLEIKKLKIQSEEQKLKRETEFRLKQLEMEREQKDRKVKNAIAIGSAVAGTVVTGGMGFLYLYYDVNGHIPSKFITKLMENTSKILVKR